jgi:acyl carrier protein
MSDTKSLDETMNTVIELVVKEFGASATDVTPDTDLTQLEGADSVKVLRVVAQIERLYDVELDDDMVFGCKTARQVAEGVQAMVAGQVTAP